MSYSVAKYGNMSSSHHHFEGTQHWEGLKAQIPGHPLRLETRVDFMLTLVNAVHNKYRAVQKQINGSLMMTSEKRWIKKRDVIWPHLPPESHRSAQIHTANSCPDHACYEQMGGYRYHWDENSFGFLSVTISWKMKHHHKSALCQTGHKLFNYMFVGPFSLDKTEFTWQFFSNIESHRSYTYTE